MFNQILTKTKVCDSGLIIIYQNKMKMLFNLVIVHYRNTNDILWTKLCEKLCKEASSKKKIIKKIISLNLS